MEFCADPSCGKPRAPQEFCCSCGADFGYADEPHPDAPVHEIPGRLDGPLGSLVRLPWGETMSLTGPSGSGKSTIAMRSLRGATVVTSEMRPHLIRAYRARLGLPKAPIAIWGPRPPRIKGRDVIYDSPSEAFPLHQLEDGVQDLIDWHKIQNTRAIFIFHVNQKGDVKGGEGPKHKVFVVVRMARDGVGSIAQVMKNRGGPCGTVRMAFDDRPLVHYFSIEGPIGGPYSAVAFAKGVRASYAEVLKRTGKNRLLRLTDSTVRLPDPPLAVAALAAPLYAVGFVEPPDGEERRAFAESSGLTYLAAEELLQLEAV